MGRDWQKQPDSWATRVSGTDKVVVGSATLVARPFGPGHYRQVDRRPGNTATSTSTCTVIIEALTFTQ